VNAVNIPYSNRKASCCVLPHNPSLRFVVTRHEYVFMPYSRHVHNPLQEKAPMRLFTEAGLCPNNEMCISGSNTTKRQALQTRHFVFSNTNFLGNQLVHYFSRAMFTNFRKRSNSVRTKRQQNLMAILPLGLLLMSVQFWVERNSFHHRLSVCFLRLYTQLVFVQI
jgi:hypothetical protein